jgi:hypothetical protein
MALITLLLLNAMQIFQRTYLLAVFSRLLDWAGVVVLLVALAPGVPV